MGRRRRPSQNELERGWNAKQAAWTAKQNAKEQAWNKWHPSNETIEGNVPEGTRTDLDRAREAGVFDPGGSPVLLDAIRQRMIGMQGGRDRQAGLSAQFYGGGDPSLAAYGHLQSTLGGSHDMSSALSDAYQNSIMQNQRFLQGMQGQTSGMEFAAKNDLMNSNTEWGRQQSVAQQEARARQNAMWGDYAMRGIGMAAGAMGGGAQGAAMGAGGGGGGGQGMFTGGQPSPGVAQWWGGFNPNQGSRASRQPGPWGRGMSYAF